MYMWHKTDTLNKTLNWLTIETSGWIFQLDKLLHRGQISLPYILISKLLPRQKQQQQIHSYPQSMHSSHSKNAVNAQSDWPHDTPFANTQPCFPSEALWHGTFCHVSMSWGHLTCFLSVSLTRLYPLHSSLPNIFQSIPSVLVVHSCLKGT
jgi:hypothetical protein